MFPFRPHRSLTHVSGNPADNGIAYRRGLMGSALGFAIGSLAVFAARPASAQTTGLRLQVGYQAPTSCPTRHEFVASLVSRLQGPVFSERDLNRSAFVQIVELPRGYSGQLLVVTDGNEPLQRTVVDRNCAALAEALALIVAMELRPQRTGVRRQATSLGPVTATDQPNSQANEQWLSQPRHPEPFRLRLAAAAGLQTGHTPGAALAIGGQVGFARLGRLPQHLGLSLLFAQSQRQDPDIGQLQLRWIGGRVAGCPFGIGATSWGIMPCAVTEIGLLRLEPPPVPRSISSNATWLAMGLGMIAALRFGSGFFEVFGGVVQPLLLHEFYLERPRPSDQYSLYSVRNPGVFTELRFGWSF